MLRNPLRPGGPPRKNPTHIRNATKAAGRMPASMAYPDSLSKPQDAASMHKLTADTVQSARRRKHVRTHGAGHDARLHSMFIMPVD